MIDDGKCIIDVVHKAGKVSDFASVNEVTGAAQKVLSDCVYSGQPHRGGMIGDVGTNYHPSLQLPIEKAYCIIANIPRHSQ